MNLELSKHLKIRIEERAILLNWIFETIDNSDKINIIAEDEIHYYKMITESSNKFLKVVVNPINNLIVTAHFDRSILKKGIL